MKYYSYYNWNQLSERTYIIISTFRYEEVKEMVKNARNNRAFKSPNNEMMVYIEKKLYDEIKGVMTHKRNLSNLREFSK